MTARSFGGFIDANSWRLGAADNSRWSERQCDHRLPYGTPPALGAGRSNIAAVPMLDFIRRIATRRPLDWTRGSGRPRATPPSDVDIIIPVYGAAKELRACLESVVRETRHHVTLVVDGPQDAAVESVIAQFPVRILCNDTRLGFVGSVNRGMRETSSDVVLLNSDTIVTPRWIEKLIDAAYSSGDVEENLLPAGFDAASFGAVVENVSQRSYRRIPTGVGVCLYIRRALLDDVGLFDEQHFGLGYGEENDFCMRALARGWVHVADDATFIYHAGHRSFGASHARLEHRGSATLRRLHPRYMSMIAAFMKSDPLADVRARIVAAITPPSDRKRRIVHLVHGWPPFQQAGTELYAYWLARRQQVSDDVSVYVRASDPSRAHGEAMELLDDGMRVRLVTNNFTARNPFRRNAIRDRLLDHDFERFLKQQRPNLLHIHHLAGHALSLARVARRLGIPIVLQIQDWWFLCARVNLYDRDGNRCTGPGVEKCARCVTLTKVAPSSITNRLLHAARRSAARSAIDATDAYVAGSESIRDDYVRAGMIDAAKPFYVIPYGVGVIANAARRAAARPIRFGYVGSIAPHKGVHVAVDAMRGIDPSHASLHIWGDAGAFPDYAADLARCGNGAAIIFEGRFREEEKAQVFASMDVLLVPSIGLESFGLAAREAMTCGVPVVASAGGALSEMFAPGEGGEFFPVGDADALHSILRRVVEEPGIIDRWSSRIRPPKRNDVHAAEIEAVYESVLRRHKS
jgi:glycosyltransferase involved in cell wall biosynthesis/GT2 family glycosyltransferase